MDSGRVWMVGIKHSKFAEEALEKSQDAEVLRMRQVNSIVSADATTETAFKTLKLRYNFVNRFLFSLQVNLSTVQMRCRLPRNTSTRL